MTSFVRAPPVTAHRAVNCIISWAPAPSKGQKSCHASPLGGSLHGEGQRRRKGHDLCREPVGPTEKVRGALVIIGFHQGCSGSATRRPSLRPMDLLDLAGASSSMEWRSRRDRCRRVVVVSSSWARPSARLSPAFGSGGPRSETRTGAARAVVRFMIRP